MAYQGYSPPAMRLQPPWASLRALGNSTAVKLTIFIPIIGYLVLLNENVLRYLELSRRIFGTETQEGNAVIAPISWRLLFLYFGLCLVASASTLYQLFCPTIVKRYASTSDFVSATFSHLSEIEYRAVVEELSRTITAPAFGLATDADRRRILAVFFVTKNMCRPWARWLTLVLYVLGFGVLSVPTLNVFYRVAVVAFAIVRQSL